MFSVIYYILLFCHFADDLLDSHTVEADSDLGIFLIVDISLWLAAKKYKVFKEEFQSLGR